MDSTVDTVSITDTERLADLVVRFENGWRSPHPHAWDDLLAEDVELAQPLLRGGRGRRIWQVEVARLLTFLPDLRGVVRSWAGSGELLFVEMECTATLGGRPIRFRAVDRLEVTAEGTVTRRESFLNPVPLAVALLVRPTAWLAWWRSGVGPLLARRRLLRPAEGR